MSLQHLHGKGGIRLASFLVEEMDPEDRSGSLRHIVLKDVPGICSQTSVWPSFPVSGWCSC